MVCEDESQLVFITSAQILFLPAIKIQCQVKGTEINKPARSKTIRLSEDQESRSKLVFKLAVMRDWLIC